MAINVIKFNESHHTGWDNFVRNSINGTLFHSRRFLNYHPKERFSDSSLIIAGDAPKDKFPDAVFAVFPAAVIKDGNETVLKSHPGTSYGGIVIQKNLGISEIDLIFESIENYAKENGIDRIDFRIGPKIFFKFPCDQIDFMIVKRGYKRDAEELSTCYPLKQYENLSEEAILKFYNDRTRRNIKKAIKNNLTARFLTDESEFVDFYKILTENLKKHSTRPVHSLEEILYLTTNLKDEAKVFGVFHGAKLVAGFLVLRISEKGWHIFYSATDYKYQVLRPANLGVFRLKQFLILSGIEYLNFGISTEKGGKVINNNLFAFKEGFNGSGISRTYWQKHL